MVKMRKGHPEGCIKIEKFFGSNHFALVLGLSSAKKGF
jgi:hypothetical protein